MVAPGAVARLRRVSGEALLGGHGDVDGEAITVVVEIPTGSRNKYEMDHETGQIFLDRMLFTSVRYPTDYGFIEGTLAGDGDPLDALVFVGEATFPGCRILVRPVGVFRMTDEKGEDEKILCVPLRDPMWSTVHDLNGLPQPLLDEIEHFFQVYKDLEGHTVSTEGFEGRSEALSVIRAARERLAARPR
jgi:inorganic pyrophosphatase